MHSFHLRRDETEVEEGREVRVEEGREEKTASESRRRYVGGQFGSRPTWERLGTTKLASTITLLLLCISRLIERSDASY